MSALGHGWVGVSLVLAWCVVLAPVVRAVWRRLRDRAGATGGEEAAIRAAYGPPSAGDVLLLLPAPGVLPGAALPPRAARALPAVPAAVVVPAAPAEPVQARLQLEMWRATERLAWDVMRARHAAELAALAGGQVTVREVR